VVHHPFNIHTKKPINNDRGKHLFMPTSHLLVNQPGLNLRMHVDPIVNKVLLLSRTSSMRSLWSTYAAILLSAASAALRFGGREDADIEKNAGEMSGIVEITGLNIEGF
jgi:hypothetical protein